MTPQGETWALGIDVSHWQGEIDWGMVAESDVQFAFIKATDGNGFVDKRFDANWAAAKKAGVIRGAYHFFQPLREPRQQATLFLTSVKLEDGDLPPVLDLEQHGNVGSGVLIQGARTWLSEVHKQLKLKPIIYTSPAFWNTFMRNQLGQPPPWTAEHSLWIAHYTQLPKPMVPAGWGQWTFWQYSDRGSVAGIDTRVDLDWFIGGTEGLRNFASGGALPEERTYVVREGDTLEEIALSRGLALGDLLAANPGIIQEGMELTIPLMQGPPGVPGPANYVVRSGDSLTTIALRFGTTVEELVALNSIQNPDLIEVGQVLRLA